MIGAERTVLALLAAGRSRRFGSSKLDEELWGKPLGEHAADTLAELPFRSRVAISGDAAIDYAALGYTVLRNPDPARGQASSVHLAAEHALTVGADALLIALADMPCVTKAHVRRLLDAAESAEAIVASSDGTAPKPPTLFGRAHVPALLATIGDHGARDLIRTARLVTAPAGELVDVDTPADLAALRQRFGR